jgi:hypothetical protein
VKSRVTLDECLQGMRNGSLNSLVMMWLVIEDHMSNFWDFFQLHPISDDVEDLAMKLFSTTLHDNARRWYDSLPDANITSMDQLEEVFLKRWSIKEDIHMLITRLNYIEKTENETVREFHTKFERLLQQIPRIHHSWKGVPPFPLYQGVLREIRIPAR